MPIYEYKCTNCNEVFDEFQPVGASNENVKCPNCGTLKPDRLLSAFSSSGSSVGGSVSSAGSCSSSGPFT
jgi:putative FmdB family regulatory protein